MATVSVQTISGDVKQLSVPTGATAAELRSLVAKAFNISTIEVGLVDCLSSQKLFFGHNGPLEEIPRELILVRNTRWASVPQDCHHDCLAVSEDRLQVKCKRGSPGYQACFLSEPLDRNSHYKIDLKLEGNSSQFYIGVVKDHMTEWSFLEGLFFYSQGIGCYDWMFGPFRFRECTVDDQLVRQCFQGECTLCLDTCVGSLALLTTDGAVAAKLDDPRLAQESSLHFCTSMFDDQVVTILSADTGRAPSTNGYEAAASSEATHRNSTQTSAEIERAPLTKPGNGYEALAPEAAAQNETQTVVETGTAPLNKSGNGYEVPAPPEAGPQKGTQTSAETKRAPSTKPANVYEALAPEAAGQNRTQILAESGTAPLTKPSNGYEAPAPDAAPQHGIQASAETGRAPSAKPSKGYEAPAPPEAGPQNTKRDFS